MATPASETFRASLRRCLANNDFLREFYESFMDSSPDVRDKFRNTEFPRQTRVLADSLYLMAVASESRVDAIAWKELDRLAERHSRNGLDIRPEFYDSWLECLIKAASAYDPDFSPDIEAAWRSSLAPGIEHLRTRY
jgi:hemoglobin-like flavoprotein